MRWHVFSYNLSRPYPGRYTTLIVSILFLGLFIMLVLINIPLSGYEIQQDFTYTPNDTLSVPPYSNLVPASLRRNPGDFVPHTFVMGETFQTNFTAFESYTMQIAYTREDIYGVPKPLPVSRVPSFTYMNHDFKACDVVYVTLCISIPAYQLSTATATIACWFPLFYRFNVVFDRQSYRTDSTGGFLQAMQALDMIFTDMEYALSTANITGTHPSPDDIISSGDTSFSIKSALKGLNITYQQCCTACDDSDLRETYEVISPDYLALLYGHPLCDDVDVKFGQSAIPSTVSWADGTLSSTNGDPFRGPQARVTFDAPSQIPILINNTLKAFYHAVRLDLGIIRPNQIYNSPIHFNDTITDVSLNYTVLYNGSFFGPILDHRSTPDPFPSFTRRARVARDVVGYIDLSNSTTNVPQILYLTSVFKAKPRAQAVAAVFVAAFSMFSAIWTIFNFVTSSLVTSRSEQAMYCPCPSCQGVDIEFAHRISAQGQSDTRAQVQYQLVR